MNQASPSTVGSRAGLPRGRPLTRRPDDTRDVQSIRAKRASPSRPSSTVDAMSTGAPAGSSATCIEEACRGIRARGRRCSRSRRSEMLTLEPSECAERFRRRRHLRQ